MSRDDVLGAVAERVRALPGEGPWLVAVDGVDGVGKTTFADGLAAALGAEGVGVVRVSMDGFHRPREERYRRGRASAEGYYRDSFDVETFIAVVVGPIREERSTVIRTAVFDHRRDLPVEGPLVPVVPGDVVVVDGVFLHRDGLAGLWDFSVFLRAPFAVTLTRMAVRDGVVGGAESPALRRYRDGQRLYMAECAPVRRASVVVDNTDVTAPRLVARSGA